MWFVCFASGVVVVGVEEVCRACSPDSFCRFGGLLAVVVVVILAGDLQGLLSSHRFM